MFINLILVAALATSTNITELKTINFFRQNPNDAYRSGRYLGDKVQPVALMYCSGQDYDSNPEADQKFVGKLYAYIRINPSYFIYRDENALHNYRFGLPWLPFKDWERFDYIEVGDPRFPFLWKNIDVIVSTLNSESEAGYLRPWFSRGKDFCLTEVKDWL